MALPRPLTLASLSSAALLTISPEPTLLFYIITLPLLLAAQSGGLDLSGALQQIAALAAGTAVRAIPAVVELAHPLEVLHLVPAAAVLLCTVIIAAPALHGVLVRRHIVSCPWAKAWSFAVLWASAITLWTNVCPFGEYGAPSTVPDPALAAYALRYLGPTGMHLVLGAASYWIFSVATAQCSTPPIALGEEAAPGRCPHRRGVPGAFTVVAAGALATLPLPLSPFTPVSIATPFTVGCAISTSRDGYVAESMRLAGQAHLVLWPEAAVAVESSDSRADTLTAVQFVSKLYGSYIAVGLHSQPPSFPRNELVLIDPNGIAGTYTKRPSVRLSESYSFERSSEPPPVWHLPLATPRGVPRSDWGNGTRDIGIMPLIGLDAFRSASVGPRGMSAPVSESLILVPAAFPLPSDAVLGHLRSLAISHSANVLVCSASARSAFAALIDPWGRILHLQLGASFATPMAVPYPRARPAWEYLGSVGTLALALVPFLALAPWGRVAESTQRARRGFVTENQSARPDETTSLI